MPETSGDIQKAEEFVRLTLGGVEISPYLLEEALEKRSLPEVFLVVCSSSCRLQTRSGLRFEPKPKTDPIYQRRGVGRKDPLIRSLGLHQDTRRVVDLSFGFGKDGFLVSRFAEEVIACEKHPLVYLLMREALESLRNGVAGPPLTLIYANSLDWLRKNENWKNTAFYFDPMFPDRQGTASPGKEMQVLRILHGDLETQRGSLDFARFLDFPWERLVIKRPSDSGVLSETPPSYAVKNGKLRFDVYKR